MKFRSVVLLAFAGSCCSAFVSSPQGRAPIHLHQAEQGTDVSIPYDAAAKLAYEAAGSQGDYAVFKDEFEANAVADVIAKRNNNRQEDSEEEESPKSIVAEDSHEEDAEEEEEEEIKAEDGSQSNKISQLQKKLKYWEGEQKIKEDEYKTYCRIRSMDGKTPPIYRREGKIDHYTPGPVFNKETDRIQKEIWTMKEQIQLVQAKIAEERRVEQVREETADRIANFDQEIDRLEDKFQGQLDQAVEEKEQIQEKAEETSKLLTEREQEVDALAKELERAKEEQERIQREAKDKMKAMESEFATSLKNMQDESEKRLAEKEKEISSLSTEIENILMHLQNKRSQLQGKEDLVASLQAEKKEKESILAKLEQERDSLRKLVGQSWNVVKTRFKKRVLRRGEKETEEDDQTSTEDEKKDEPMLVRSRERTST